MEEETHQSPSSSAESYEVFLNFRGEDTRTNFTDHLYAALVRAGIRTFRDKEELKNGEKIELELFKTIEESRISVLVFSKNYASSKWCLNELAKIMDCKRTYGQIVWPIFYEVDPSHVRNQTGSFAEAFLDHEEKQCKEMVDRWREAMREAGNLKGWDSGEPENRYESNLINFVVKKALTELNETTLKVAKYPIGIDSQVEEVMGLLDVESNDVQFVGIHGMGGIGKTTIAKAVFNRVFSHFQGCSFLADVREKSSQCEGLVNLQNQLGSDILKGNNLGISIVDKGINVIKRRCCEKKVLIILDDVDHYQQLDALAGGCDWFGPGSRIIITTRNEHILNVGQVDKRKIYKPKELNANQSLCLLSNHAFSRDEPPQDFREISENIVRKARGLPLALEVLGSFLRGQRSPIEWESVLKKLNKIPDADAEVQKKLKISYDGLDDEYKNVFLDIACFFIGMDEETVIHILEDSFGIKDLIRKSLVKIDDENKVRMHDLLRDMGREIVRQESPNDPGKRSRLWSHDEALDVLKKREGTRKVEGLLLRFGYGSRQDHCLRIEAFEAMSRLRLLQVDHADFNGKFDNFPKGLKWLSCKGLPFKCIPTISHLKKLVVLDMSRSHITEDWNGWQQIQLIKTLKVLDLSGCLSLTRTPNFSCHTNLERLSLNCCERLVACDESIGHLKKLVFLSLVYCINLTELPDIICKLSSIKSLILKQCFKLGKLPKALGTMKSLSKLIIDETAIEELPDTIISLVELERLSARHCRKLVKLPHSIGKLRLLHHFDMEGTGIAELPGDFGMLSSLEELKMAGCKKFNYFPKNFGNLAQLSILDANNCNISEGAIPSDFGRLSLLKFLDLSYSRFCSLPTSFSILSQLQTMNLNSCTKLQSLPELPSSLIQLNAMQCFSIKRLPNLSNLKCLKDLRLNSCVNLAKIEGMNGLPVLQYLDLSNCRMLQSLPELPPSLIRLDIRHCISMERLPSLLSLKNLEDLFLVNCKNLVKIVGIDGLSLLQQLDLTECRKLQSLSELPSSLTKLVACGCVSIERLPDLSNLKRLRVLQLLQCENLSEIHGISGLSLLQKLYLRECTKLQSLPKLPSSLITLEAVHCSSMERLPDLSNLENLEQLTLGCCDNLAEIQGLESLESLIDLSVRGCNTHVNTLQKSVAQRLLRSAFDKGEIWKCYLLPDYDNINGTVLNMVYELLGPPASCSPSYRHVFSIQAIIRRNDGKEIHSIHDLRLESMVETNEDQCYSCYFQGLTWFGFPLKNGDLTDVAGWLNVLRKEGVGAKPKMFDLVLGYDYEAEDSPQLEKLVDLITSTCLEREGVGGSAKKRRREHDDDDDAGPSTSGVT